MNAMGEADLISKASALRELQAMGRDLGAFASLEPAPDQTPAPIKGSQQAQTPAPAARQTPAKTPQPEKRPCNKMMQAATGKRRDLRI